MREKRLLSRHFFKPLSPPLLYLESYVSAELPCLLELRELGAHVKGGKTGASPLLLSILNTGRSCMWFKTLKVSVIKKDQSGQWAYWNGTVIQFIFLCRNHS